jgi:hypothetical protein
MRHYLIDVFDYYLSSTLFFLLTQEYQGRISNETFGVFLENFQEGFKK